MSIDITVRHMSINVATQDYARQKAEELLSEFRILEHVHVILDHQKHATVTEVIARAKKHVNIESSESSDNIITSMDKAFNKAEKQLRKVAEKIHDHKGAMKKRITEEV